MQAKEIKNGSIIEYMGSPVMIESISVNSPSARGAATLYLFRGRNLVTKQKTDIKVKGTESLDEADFEKRSIKLMYSDASDMHFLDQVDFNQYSLPIEDLSNENQLHHGITRRDVCPHLQQRVCWNSTSCHG